MSVKLIVVALLAASVSVTSVSAAAEASDKKIVKAVECANGEAKADTCECAATTTNTKEYPTTCPANAGVDNIFWRADSCTDATAAFVVKGYKTNACTAGEKKVSKNACEAKVYDKATCDGTSVKLYTGCSSSTCDANCHEPVTFATGECKIWNGKYLKLKSADACKDDSVANIMFENHETSQTCEKSSPQDMPIPKACTATRYYGKATCTAADKVSFKSCAPKAGSSGNDDCTGTCTTIDVALDQYASKVNGETVYIRECPASGATEITFEVYAGVKQYSKDCTDTGSAHAKATCADASTSAPSTTEGSNTTEDTNDTTTTSITEGSSTTSTTGSSTADSSNNTSENTTEGSGVIAPAHSAGVLALVLCLLACVY